MQCEGITSFYTETEMAQGLVTNLHSFLFKNVLSYAHNQKIDPLNAGQDNLKTYKIAIELMRTYGMYIEKRPEEELREQIPIEKKKFVKDLDARFAFNGIKFRKTPDGFEFYGLEINALALKALEGRIYALEASKHALTLTINQKTINIDDDFGYEDWADSNFSIIPREPHSKIFLEEEKPLIRSIVMAGTPVSEEISLVNKGVISIAKQYISRCQIF